MTRDEFIDGYMERSKVERSARWEHGFEFGGDRLIAMPCACEEGCDGWAMIGLDEVHDHLFFKAPEPLHSLYREAIGYRPIVVPRNRQ